MAYSEWPTRPLGLKSGAKPIMESLSSPLPAATPSLEKADSGCPAEAVVGPTRRLAGKGLWFLGLFPGASLMGLWSHHALEAGVGLYGVPSARVLRETGLTSLGLWLLVMLCVLGAARLFPPLRAGLTQVVWLVTVLMLSGVFWSVLTIGVLSLLGAGPQPNLASLGGLVAMVVWLRVCVLGARGLCKVS